MKTLIIVPAHNEENSLPVLIPQILKLGFEVLVINDASTDSTKNILDELEFNHIDLPNNVGLASVTQIGFIYAKDHGYDSAVVIDGDGQHPPIYISKLLDELQSGYDYVLGSRFISNKKPWTMRMVGSRILSRAIQLKTGKLIHDPTSGMRAINFKVIAEFSKNMNFIAEPDALTYILKKGYRFKEVQVDMIDRTTGVSYFRNPVKSIIFMYQTLISILFLQS